MLFCPRGEEGDGRRASRAKRGKRGGADVDMKGERDDDMKERHARKKDRKLRPFGWDARPQNPAAPLQKFPDNIAIRRLKTKKKIKGRKETEKTAEERRTHRV